MCSALAIDQDAAGQAVADLSTEMDRLDLLKEIAKVDDDLEKALMLKKRYLQAQEYKEQIELMEQKQHAAAKQEQYQEALVIKADIAKVVAAAWDKLQSRPLRTMSRSPVKQLTRQEYVNLPCFQMGNEQQKLLNEGALDDWVVHYDPSASSEEESAAEEEKRPHEHFAGSLKE